MSHRCFESLSFTVYILLVDGQVVFLRVLRFSPTFDERSAQYKWNILERAVKPKSKKKKKKKIIIILLVDFSISLNKGDDFFINMKKGDNFFININKGDNFFININKGDNFSININKGDNFCNSCLLSCTISPFWKAVMFTIETAHWPIFSGNQSGKGTKQAKYFCYPVEYVICYL